jgi:hypothetical protein
MGFEELIQIIELKYIIIYFIGVNLIRFFCYAH